MENFGIIHAFLNAGMVNKIVFILLLLISIYSWGIIIKKYRELRIAKKNLEAFQTAFASQNHETINAYIFSHNTHYSDLIEVIAEDNAKSSGDKDQVKKDCQYIVDKTILQLEEGTNVLATVASASPFIGLFGTVIGVINSFAKIGATSSASLSIIAPGIAEALYATALGLFVAVPASIFYNLITHQIDVYTSQQASLLDKILGFINYTKKVD